jgi:hypothetical protein
MAIGGAGSGGSGVRKTGGNRKCAVDSVSGSECGVTAAEVSTVDRTGPVSVSVVSDSNDGDAENSVWNGLDSEKSYGNGSSGDGGDNKGEDSADGVNVTKISGALSACWSSSVRPDDSRPSEVVEALSRLVGSWMRRVSSSLSERCALLDAAVQCKISEKNSKTNHPSWWAPICREGGCSLGRILLLSTEKRQRGGVNE